MITVWKQFRPSQKFSCGIKTQLLYFSVFTKGNFRKRQKLKPRFNNNDFAKTTANQPNQNFIMLLKSIKNCILMGLRSNGSLDDCIILSCMFTA